MIDSHCHLTDEKFANDLPDVMARAEAAGVHTMITIGAGDGVHSSSAAVELAEKFGHIFATVGLHPHDADLIDDDVMDHLGELASHPKVVGIGETGLDYHYSFADVGNQHEAFVAQLELAVDRQLPIIIHQREAEDDMLGIFDDMQTLPNGVIHCFTQNTELAKLFLDHGFYLSMPGVITFKKADELRAAARFIPLDRLLIETDSPYLAPVPYRGKRNEPAYVLETAKALAEARGMELQALIDATTENARRLFGCVSS